MNYQEIREYVERNNEMNLLPDELDHVAMCLEHIDNWYHKGEPLGGFLQAVVANDLTEALFRADAVNSKALKLYAYFLTWNLPADWRERGTKYKIRR